MIDTKPPPDFVSRRKSIGLSELMRSSPRQVPVVSALLLLNLAVFALMLVYGGGFWHSANGVQLAWGANFGPATQDGQWWRLFTAMFIHFGVVHLAFNMWALWDVGRLVERVFGRLRFALLYLGSGVIGNLVSLVVQGNQAVSGGASGAIFSLYGALLVFLLRERRRLDRAEFRWMFGAALAFTLLMLGVGLVVPGIDNGAHVGGLLAGAFLGRVLAKPWASNLPGAARGRWLTATVLVLAIAVLVIKIPAPSYRFGEELRAREAIRQFLSDDQRISQQWEAILAQGQREGLTFEQVAGSLDAHVTAVYEHSFEQLMAASPVSKAPSAKTLETLQTYATLRADASRELAEGLRSQDSDKIRKAMAQAQKAQTLATGVKPLGAASSNVK